MIKSFRSKKIGLFSDIHIGYGQDSTLWHDNILTFGKWASDKFENLGISEIMITGDIFHNRSDISVKTLDIAKQFFDMFKEFQLIISTGNHDAWYRDSSEIHSLSIFKEWQNITIIDSEPKLFGTLVDKVVSIIPWGTKLEDFPTSDICFSHLDIKSFYQNNYHVCEKGFESADLFKKSKFIVSGHFHKKDYREYSSGKIMYVGSPFQMNFGECGDERGIYTFNLEDESFDFIENEVSSVHKKIKVSDITKKKIGAEELKNSIPDNIIRLIVDQKITPDIHSILVSKIQKYEPKNLTIEFELLDSVGDSLPTDGDVGDVSDLSQFLDDYVEAMDTPNKEDLKDYLNDVYNTLK